MKSLLIIILFLIFNVPSTNGQTKCIKEETFVSIGGIEQWITIRGEDLTKPLVLFLHGGPGSVMSPFMDSITYEWRKDFIMVNWDQRGAGRTFGKNAPVVVDEDYWIENPLTLQQMVDDGIALSEYLVDRLDKKKIIIVGTSWGSVLGVEMALQRPDLFHAYIGHSQIINPSKNLLHAYNTVLEMAKTKNDSVSISNLKSLGELPFDDARKSGQLFRIIKKYERQNSVQAPEWWWDPAAEYNNEIDTKNQYDGDDYSFINYIGHNALGIKPMMAEIDFMKNGLHFQVPVYIIQGENDILTQKEFSKAYFDEITAPKKEYLLIPGAAHGYNQAIIDAQFKVLKEKIAVDIKQYNE